MTLDQWMAGSFLIAIILYIGISSAILGPLSVILGVTTAKGKKEAPFIPA